MGSNVGDREQHLVSAVTGLSAMATLVAISSIYETAPVGGPDQGPFLNAVAVIDTALAPMALMEALLVIERARGRRRLGRWGPRTLDLDLLLYGDHTIDRPALSVPHPRMLERRFVTEPLLEAWPEAAMPDGTLIADVAVPGDDPMGMQPWPGS
jgi:2-amino-4-hydroxy-6-hydroxymethyldihydropteridine diphosphokinase